MVAMIMSELAIIIHGQVTLKNSLIVFALTLGYGFAYAVNNYMDKIADSKVITEIVYTIPLHEVIKLNPGWRRDLPSTKFHCKQWFLATFFSSYFGPWT